MRWYVVAVVMLLCAGAAALWLWTTAPVTLPDDRPVSVKRPVVGAEKARIAPPMPAPPMPKADGYAVSEPAPLLTRREEYGNCSYNRGYRDGWKEGVRAAMQRTLDDADSTLSSVPVPLWAAGLGTGVSGVLFGLLGLVLGRGRKSLKYCFKPRNPKPKTRKLAASLLCAVLLSSGCSAFQREAAGDPPVPMPPLKAAPEASRTSPPAHSAQQGPQGTPLAVEVPAPPSSGPRVGDPDLLPQYL